MPITTDQLHSMINKILPELIEFRHDLHSHPELMYEENRTSDRIKEALETNEIDFACNLAGGTGVLALLDGHKTDQTIALRADIDALPIEEQTELPYTSKNPGIMHACGHDGHTTILIGAARILKQIADQLPDGLIDRPVKFIFQPAEEGGAGGKRMVEDGVLTDQLLGPAVSEIYALHDWPTLELGKVSTRPGPLLAAADMFTVKITGHGGHAAWPHETRDPLIAGTAIVQALQTIVSRETDPLDAVVVSVTKFHTGTATNIIENTAQIAGTLRTLSEEVRAQSKERIDSIAQHIAKAHRCEVTIEWEKNGYPVTFNNPETVERFFEIARATVGPDNAPLCPNPFMGGEDFSFYCREVPACFFLLGQVPKNKDNDAPTEPYPMLHTPKFNFNDESIPLGVEIMCRLALSG